MSGPLGTATGKNAGSRLHERMLEAGWSPDEIEAIEGALWGAAAVERGPSANAGGDFDEAA